MQATAISSSVSRISNTAISIDRVLNIFIKTSVAELIMVIRRCPAVMLAVSRTPSAMGRINRLTVSINTMNGISGVGDPSGSMWAKAAVGFVVIPVITVANHIGMASAIFIDSWDVGVNVYGSRLRRLDNMININSPARNRDHFCPFGESWCTMLFNTVLINHLVIVDIRFPSRVRFGCIKATGRSMDTSIVGSISTSGLANCSNMFMFMVVLVLVLFCCILLCLYLVHC